MNNPNEFTAHVAEVVINQEDEKQTKTEKAGPQEQENQEYLMKDLEQSKGEKEMFLQKVCLAFP